MLPREHFRHCPRCGRTLDAHSANPLVCSGCAFTYFFNPTVAAGAFIDDGEGRMIYVRRAKEPAKGLLGVPGGFIDVGETAEAALRREVLEEVNLEIENIRFLCSCPNLYEYREVTYPVCDLMFTAAARDAAAAQALDGVDAFEWHRPEDLTDEMLAFPSLRLAHRCLLDDSRRNWR